MKNDSVLEPIEQQRVIFYEDEITAVLVQSGGKPQIFIPLKPICDRLGVTWPSQLNRINRDPVLSKKLKGIFIMNTPGGRQEMSCLPLDYLNGWLFGIDTRRVKEEIRDRLIRYQEECFKVLSEAFQEGRLTTDPDFDTLLHQASADAVEAYQMALAVVKLARNQIMIEARLDDYGRRLEAVEATLSVPERFVTREQASRISQAVRAIGHVLSERNGRSEYGAVYGELYRNFEVSAYRELPAQKYEEAMKWLNAWYQRLTNQDIPF
ncbi:MAG: ORF6C domain-containing protein [Anaerolineae bacterium]|nr:ORF6C domain-containing protein [Anaerolineae bacterium]